MPLPITYIVAFKKLLWRNQAPVYPPPSHTRPTKHAGSRGHHRQQSRLTSSSRSEHPRRPARVLDTYSHRSPALVAQGIEHGSPKAGVAGSNPAEGTFTQRSCTRRIR